MPIYHPLRGDTAQSNEKATSTHGLDDEDDRGAVQRLYEGLGGLTTTQFEELEEALMFYNEELSTRLGTSPTSGFVFVQY